MIVTRENHGGFIRDTFLWHGPTTMLVCSCVRSILTLLCLFTENSTVLCICTVKITVVYRVLRYVAVAIAKITKDFLFRDQPRESVMSKPRLFILLGVLFVGSLVLFGTPWREFRVTALIYKYINIFKFIELLFETPSSCPSAS